MFDHEPFTEFLRHHQKDGKFSPFLNWKQWLECDEILNCRFVLVALSVPCSIQTHQPIVWILQTTGQHDESCRSLKHVVLSLIHGG